MCPYSGKDTDSPFRFFLQPFQPESAGIRHSSSRFPFENKKNAIKIFHRPAAHPLFPVSAFCTEKMKETTPRPVLYPQMLLKNDKRKDRTASRTVRPFSMMPPLFINRIKNAIHTPLQDSINNIFYSITYAVFFILAAAWSCVCLYYTIVSFCSHNYFHVYSIFHPCRITWYTA